MEIPEKLKGPIYDSDVWQPVHMINQRLLDMGYTGGEGCQCCICIVIDPVKGDLCYMGTDVGGVFKSTDKGHNWAPCTVGIDACGLTGIAIDPNNSKRAIGCGCNSGPDPRNGLYITEDEAESWDHVFPCALYCFRDYRVQIAFDETSYSKKINGSKRVYWAREADLRRAAASKDYDLVLGIYKSEDGGRTWELLPGTEDMANANIFVHCKKGWVYAANANGLFRSKDKGATWEKLFNDNILGIDIIRSHPDNIYISTYHGLFVSEDCGDTFKKVESDTFPTTYPIYLRVSPADPRRMTLQDAVLEKTGKWGWSNYYTHDGGVHWYRSRKDPTGMWIPNNHGLDPCWWHPTEDMCLSICGYISRSEDGGALFKQSNSGWNGMCFGGQMKINDNHPNLVFTGSQDYNGAFSNDGGRTWKYIEWSGAEWGGWTYGGYPIGEQEIVTGIADRMFGRGKIAVTHDGGKTIERTDIEVKGMAIASGVIGNDDIIMFGEWRSTDRGHTWTQMTDCDGVFTCCHKTGLLVGRNKGGISISRNGGETWKKIIEFEQWPTSAAYNWKTDKILFSYMGNAYEVSTDGSGLRMLDWGIKTIKGIWIDPNDCDIMFARAFMSGNRNVWRSEDGGNTWVCLNRYKGDGRTGLDGGNPPHVTALNYETRELLVGAGCRGMWKIPMPDELKNRTRNDC